MSGFLRTTVQVLIRLRWGIAVAALLVDALLRALEAAGAWPF